MPGSLSTPWLKDLKSRLIFLLSNPQPVSLTLKNRWELVTLSLTLISQKWVFLFALSIMLWVIDITFFSIDKNILRIYATLNFISIAFIIERQSGIQNIFCIETKIIKINVTDFYFREFKCLFSLMIEFIRVKGDFCQIFLWV